MIRIILGVFIVLHGLVHLLYFGQSARFFELAPSLTWPDDARIFSRWIDHAAIRNFANVSLILTAVILIASSIGVFLQQDWWRPVILAGLIISTLIYLLMWNGKMQGLDQQGGIGILINLALMVVVRWIP